MKGSTAAGIVGLLALAVAGLTIFALVRLSLIQSSEIISQSLTVILATFTIVLGIATVYLGAETRRLVSQTRLSLIVADIHHQERLSPLCKPTRPCEVATSPNPTGTNYDVKYVVKNVGLGPAYKVETFFVDPVGKEELKGCEPLGVGEEFALAFTVSSKAPYSKRTEWTILVRYRDRFDLPYETELKEGQIRVTGPNPDARNLSKE